MDEIRDKAHRRIRLEMSARGDQEAWRCDLTQPQFREKVESIVQRIIEERKAKTQF